MKKLLCCAVLVAVCSAVALPAFAQDDTYPTKPVRLIVTSAPGGNPDILARMLADKLSKELGRPIIAENMPGASGVIATETVAKARQDPYILLIASSGGMAIIPTAGATRYDPERDFTPITALAAVPTVLVVHPSVGVASLDAFIKLAKERPNQLNYSSGGPLSIHNLTMAMFMKRAGISLTHIPYRQGSPAAAAVVAGEVQASWVGIPNAQQGIEDGKLRALALSIRDRSAALPNVPTLAEQGFKDFDVGASIGLAAPAGIPPAVVARLQTAVAKAIREPDIVMRMTQLGMSRLENGTADYIRLIREEAVFYAEATKAAGLSTD